MMEKSRFIYIEVIAYINASFCVLLQLRIIFFKARCLLHRDYHIIMNRNLIFSVNNL